MKNFLLAIGLYLLSSLTFATESIKLTEDNTLVLNKKFTMENVSKVLIKAFKLSTSDPKKDLYLVLDSPGGSVTAGMSLITGLNDLPNKVHTITLFAASMGYQTVQNLGTRYISPYGILMSHRARLGGLGGQIPGELDTRLKFYKDLVKELDVSTSKRVGLSIEDYSKLIHDEYWVIGRHAVENNHADKVASITCSKEMYRGVISERYTTVFGIYDVEWSKCPIIRFPVSIKPTRKEYEERLPEVIEHFNNLRNEKSF